MSGNLRTCVVGVLRTLHFPKTLFPCAMLNCVQGLLSRRGRKPDRSQEWQCLTNITFRHEFPVAEEPLVL